ncbi:MAG: M20/M25/M40 family metallo-hydrolase [Armatimonadetes bacterium]|nr:M20/M25/M40 family metallo-hydrolase [Armatimonadota bacterium]
MIDREQLVELFINLCRINSPPRQEREVVDFVKNYLSNLGLYIKEDRAGEAVGGNANNVIATLPANRSGAPKIFFSAHFDTVEPNPNLRVVIKDEIIKSDGTSILGSDDKSGMAAILQAVRAVVENDLPHGQIQLLFSICEEVGLLGARHLDMALVDSDYGFVFDSGSPVGTVINSAPTHDSMRFKVIGRPAHAGVQPEKGISAIKIAADAISQMTLGRIDEETTANIGVIEGGTANNIVCPEVNVRAEARSRSVEKVDAQTRHMIDCFEQAAARAGGQVEVQKDRHYTGYLLTDDQPQVKLAMEAIRDVGLEPNFRPTGGGSDGSIYLDRGLPSVVLGTPMEHIHTHQEQTPIAALVKSSEIALAIIRRAAGA